MEKVTIPAGKLSPAKTFIKGGLYIFYNIHKINPYIYLVKVVDISEEKMYLELPISKKKTAISIKQHNVGTSTADKDIYDDLTEAGKAFIKMVLK